VDCPNCESPFRPEKAGAETEVPKKTQEVPKKPTAAPAANVNKTLLGEVDATIRYRCPQCKKQLESPSIEAGSRKNCPECGHRFQIPTSSTPAPAPSPPNPNKTLLASAEPTATTTKSPASSTKMKAPAPPVRPAPQRTAPAPRSGPLAVAPGTHRFLTSTGMGLFLLGLGACVFSILYAVLTGNTQQAKIANAQVEYEKAKKDLEELKGTIELTEARLAQNKVHEAKMRQQWDNLLSEQRNRQRDLDLQEELDRNREELRKDPKLAAAAKERRRRDQVRLDQDERKLLADQAKFEADAKAKREELLRELETANQRVEQAAALVKDPPPPPLPAYDPRRYFGW
jgi:DNA-directed RNA polymerase subunit RPC12/RpoP